MKFTLSWLKDYLDTSASVDEIAAGLLGIGLEVEEISDKTKALSAFTVAHVTVADKHPNADKLRLCVVETKDGTKQVVRHQGHCGFAGGDHSGDGTGVCAGHHSWV